MNVKSVTPNLASIADLEQKVETPTGVKAEASSKDKEGSGRRDPEDQSEAERHLTDEEMEETIEYLRKLPGIQDSSLTIEWELQGDLKVAHVIAPDGSVVRRMTELELSTLKRDSDVSTGRLFYRSG